MAVTCRAITRLDIRHQLLAQKLAERRGAADARRDLLVLFVLRRAGQVAASLGVLDADEHEGTHRAVADGDLHEPRDVQEVLSKAAVRHVKNREALVGCFGVAGRQIHVDSTWLAQGLGLQCERLTNR